MRRKSVDPKTGIAPISEWGPECGRGFVRDARFGRNERVIEPTNRATTRRWRALDPPSPKKERLQP